MYQTKYEGQGIGIYNAQRPSVAACKTFSMLRRRNPKMQNAEISVVTEGNRKIEHNYMVTYKNDSDAFLGNIMRPVAVPFKAADLKAADLNAADLNAANAAAHNTAGLLTSAGLTRVAISGPVQKIMGEDDSSDATLSEVVSGS